MATYGYSTVLYSTSIPNCNLESKSKLSLPSSLLYSPQPLVTTSLVSTSMKPTF